jgi:hypothetical protein
MMADRRRLGKRPRKHRGGELVQFVPGSARPHDEITPDQLSVEVKAGPGIAAIIHTNKPGRGFCSEKHKHAVAAALRYALASVEASIKGDGSFFVEEDGQ